MKTIKNALYLGVTTLAIMGFTPQASAGDNMHKSMNHHGQTSAEHKEIMGSGVVNNIDLDNRKINLSHEAIPALKWPKMTMDMNVSDNIDLNMLSPDEAINFHIELGADKVYRITKIMKTEASGLKYLKHTENQYICMVNNKRFDKAQIPVAIDGKTYYGCCSMCKGKLEGSKELREAKDPVSGNVVDKSSAVIGTGPDDTAYYFENEENMKKFDASKSSHEKSSDHDHKH